MAVVTGVILAMAVIILCPKCGSTRLMKIKVKDGEKLRCPKCRYTLTDGDRKK
jgi:transposase-like protein